MPIYEYVCEKCEHEFEHLAKSMSASNEKVECPKCHSMKTGRKLSVVAINGGAKPSGQQAGGHVHSGMCGCGKMRGSCGSGLN